MKKANIIITESEYIIISKGLSHLINEYNNDDSLKKYISRITDLKSKLVKPFNK